MKIRDGSCTVINVKGNPCDECRVGSLVLYTEEIDREKRTYRRGVVLGIDSGSIQVVWDSAEITYLIFPEDCDRRGVLWDWMVQVY